MHYKQFNKIDQRFKRALDLISTGKMNARTLAKELSVSRPTVLRMVNELRRRGYIISVVHDYQGWRYEVARDGNHYIFQGIKLEKSTKA